jgi:CRISPR type I-E-associated protein CasB/Cse2
MPTVDELRVMVEVLAARSRRDTATRAALQRALHRPLQEAPRAVPLIAAWLPTQPDPDTDDAVLLAAALAASHPDLHKRGSGLGAALARSGGHNSDRRLAVACRSDQTLLCTRHLPDLAHAVARSGQHLDLGLLGWQAATWARLGDETARHWLRDYYRTAAQSTDPAPATS